jgi:hypothetical protein
MTVPVLQEIMLLGPVQVLPSLRQFVLLHLAGRKASVWERPSPRAQLQLEQLSLSVCRSAGFDSPAEATVHARVLPPLHDAH